MESFFVLSGFLLTSLLVAEHRRHGAIALGAYAERRVRRIAPALVVLVAAVVVIGPVVAPDDAHRLGSDVLASLAGATNWRLIADASSYFDQAGRPSLLRHLWSVAVEIQFYVLCPFLVAWLSRRRRAVAVVTLAVGVAPSAVAMALLFEGDDPSRAYFGTDARVGALLAGALLALVLAGPRGREGRATVESSTRRAVSLRPAAVVLGPLALVSLVSLVALFFLADDRARWSYPGPTWPPRRRRPSSSSSPPSTPGPSPRLGQPDPRRRRRPPSSRPAGGLVRGQRGPRRLVPERRDAFPHHVGAGRQRLRRSHRRFDPAAASTHDHDHGDCPPARDVDVAPPSFRRHHDDGGAPPALDVPARSDT